MYVGVFVCDSGCLFQMKASFKVIQIFLGAEEGLKKNEIKHSVQNHSTNFSFIPLVT